MIEEYENKRKELDARFERETPEMLESGERVFKIETWVPGTKPT